LHKIKEALINSLEADLR